WANVGSMSALGCRANHGTTSAQRTLAESDLKTTLGPTSPRKRTAFYRRGIALVPERWEKVVENGGNYLD
ncbi:hypothetical protein ALC57_10641, partial [Trachymyrmex cornetzi]